MMELIAQPDGEWSSTEIVREPPGTGVSRRAVARRRLPLARAALAGCRLCEHRCGVNRLQGEHGLCKAGAQARVFSAQVEVADELEIIPTFAIALSGCDLRCAFCITGEASWNPHVGEEFSPEALAAEALTALADGARTITILGGEPAIHLPTVLEIVAALPDDALLVWKTNAHATAEARALLDGLFDVWLPDFKFGNDECARRIARVPVYTRVVQENLRWMAGRRSGVSEERCSTVFPEGRWRRSPETPLRDTALANRESELIVRHLLLPGHVECCWRLIAAWLAEELPGVKVSLRTEYWPAWQASRHIELRGAITETERRRAGDIAQEFALNLIA